MAKQFLPPERRWTQPNDGGGTLTGTYGVDFEADRGKVRVSKPTRRLFDENTALDKFRNSVITTGDAEPIDQIAGSFHRYDGEYFAIASVPYFTNGLTSADDPLDSTNWLSEESTGAPDSNVGGAVWDSKLVVIENTGGNGKLVSYNGSSWSDYLDTSGATLNKTIGNINFIEPSKDGNLYVVDEDNYVHRLKPDATADWGSDGDQGTLDFSAKPYSFTCVADNSTRLFIGFENTNTGRGGIVEWDRGATTLTANRIHELSAIPRCMAVWDDLVVVIMSDGTIKYFNNTAFVNYDGMHLPKIESRYDDEFIHHKGWAIIDNLPHFLIKGGQTINQSDTYSKNISGSLQFPSAVYCLDPQMGFYPRFALTNNTLTEDHYGLPAIAEVGALYSLNEDDSKFLASYEIYTDSSTDIAVISYHDERHTTDSNGWILYNDIDRNDASKQIEMLHRVMQSGNSIKAYYQEYEEDETTISGVWSSTTEFNTTETISVDDKWLAWVKTGSGAGQFLRVETQTDTTNTSVITFKDTNSFATLNDASAITFIKFSYFGKADSATKDYTNLTFPSAARTRKIRILYELTQVAGTVNELDYTILDT